MTLLLPQGLRAQGDALDATIRVVFETAGEREYRTVQYALFKTEKKAGEVMQAMEAALALQRGDMGSIVLTAWEDATRKNKIKFRKSRGNGDIRLHAYPDMAVLITSYLPEDELTAEGARFAVVTLHEGQTDYEQLFKSKVGEGIHTVDNVEVLGVNRDTITIGTAPAIDDGKNLYFRIHVELPEGYGNENGRLVVQPVAVDCQTEDTVEYVSGIVMEGRKYHAQQTRKMRFDYMKNDKVAYAYIPQLMWQDEKIVIDTTLVYRKPERRKTYKIPFEVKIADMNHVYFSRKASTGSCNGRNIFKFLDLGVAAADMDVEEFHIDAESSYTTKNQDLRLKFEVGKSVLLSDSANQRQVEALVEELKSYGEQLMEVRVEATASPEGGMETNRQLASERTRVAANRVRSYLGKVDVAYHIAQPRVFSWEDVAKELEQDGHGGVAAKVRGAMGAGGFGGDAAIMAMEEYDTLIVPVLENLRMMRVTYRYEKEHVMDETEVRQAYYQRKHDLLRGKGKDFSDGDYYNLFRIIKDSLEQDTLTMIAYRHITRHGGYEQVKFSMYVANRMAMLNQRRGKPDARVLSPFINQRLRAVTTKEDGDRAQKNRREVLINQIITYFQMEERDTALSYCNYWFANDKDPKVERLRQYITFKEGFVRYATRQLAPDEEKKVEDAMNFVFTCARDNKAVIYAEAHDMLGVSPDDAAKLVRQMEDSNPKKWYLMGLLHAAKEEERLMTAKGKDYVPDYLAYFHHCFLMEPEYKWLYFNEGQVSDELREKFRYRRKDYPRYAEMFGRLAVISDDERKDAGAEDGEIEISGDDDDAEE